MLSFGNVVYFKYFCTVDVTLLSHTFFILKCAYGLTEK